MSTSTPLPRKSTVMSLRFRQISSTELRPPTPGLQDTLQRFIPCQQTYNATRKSYLPADLKSVSHVFIRVDAAKPPLTPPYTGPYKVLQRKEKSYKIQIRNSTDWISIDRLKPAYLLQDDQPDVTFSRAGRPLRGRHLPQGGTCSGDRLEATCHHYKYFHVITFISAFAMLLYVIVMSLNISGYFLYYIVLSAFDLIRSCYNYCLCF